jgi:hypothetical protein
MNLRPVRLVVLVAMSAMSIYTGAAHAQMPKEGTLAVHFDFDPGAPGQFAGPIEGFFSYMDVVGRGLHAEWPGASVRDLAVRLPVGLYRLKTYARTCDGTCNTLDPPTALCAHRFRMRPSEVMRARVVVNWAAPGGDYCRMTMRRSRH